MTPEERAQRACDQMTGFLTRVEWCILVADEIHAAVAEEREACAQLADEWALAMDEEQLDMAMRPGDVIRARGQYAS